MFTVYLLLLPQLAAGEPAEKGKSNGTEVSIRAQGAWPWEPIHKPVSLPRQIQELVFRSRADMERVAGKHGLVLVAAGLQLEDIDFKKHTLLAVADGTQPMVGVSGGGPPSAPYRVHISRVDRDEKDGQVTVHWQRIPRGPRDLLSYPLEMVVVQRIDGKVHFERGPDPKAPAVPPKASGGKEVKVVARAFWPDGQIADAPARQWVIRHYEDLVDPRIKANEEVIERLRQAEAKKYAQALGVPAIDFARYLVVGVSAGVQQTGGYRVVIRRIDQADKDGAITVHWRLQPPARDRKAPAQPTHPATVLLIEQSVAPVHFDPPVRPGREERQSPRRAPGRSGRD